MSERLPLGSIALVSAGALADEILLTRFFGIIHWYHFAYMMISLALLGFGASGTFLALARRPLLRHFDAAFTANLALFGLFAVLAPPLAAALPFRTEELLWDPLQPVWLALTYLLLSIPFFCAANAIGLALIAHRERAGRIYAADLVGAGCGSLVIVGVLYLAAPEHALKLVGAAGCLAAALAAAELQTTHRALRAVGFFALLAVIAVPASLLKPQPGPYKGLSQALRIGGTRVVVEHSSPLGRVTVIESSRVPLRHAPGLSLNATAELPPQLGVFIDGDGMDAITDARRDASQFAWLEQSTSALAYEVSRPRSVLVLGAGGGVEILRAIHFGAERIDAVELNPQVAQLLIADLDAYSGRLLERGGVALHIGDARGFLAANPRRYDLLQMPLAAASGGGLGGLTEDYLHTVEAIELYLRHLEPDGFLSLTRYVQIPPRDALKLLATTIEALRAGGAQEPGRRLVMIRGWQTATLLVKNGDVTEAEIARVHAFCERYSFDVAWYPGMPRAAANRYNELPQPWFYEGARALLGPRAGQFVDRYPFDIRPATDDRPYFQNFFRRDSFVEAWGAKGRGGMALLEAGYAVLGATLAQALVAGLVLIVLPLFALRAESRTPGSRWRAFAYFASIGLAFLFIEIVFLQKVLRVLHHPTTSLALALATFLIAAGAGSAWMTRPSPPNSTHVATRSRLGISVLCILLLGALYAFGFDIFLALFAAWPMSAKAALCVLLIAPLAFFMGAPFPLALRELEAPLVPWAWGINGCASVVSPALATLLAIDVGFSAVLWIALALYFLTPAVLPRTAALRPA
jgi:hypothetical protein